MAISIEQNDGFLSITATGGQTDLDFDFPLYEKSHLQILRTRSGTTTTLVLNTDYTIADGELEQEAGGTAVLNSGAAVNDIYTLLLNVPEARTTDFNNAGDFKAETLNRELDLQTQMMQQLRRDVDKSATLPDTSTLTSLELPTPTASSLIGWNSAADGLTNYTALDVPAANVSAFAATLLDDTTASAARTTLGAAASGANSDITNLTGLSVTKSIYIPVALMRPQTSGGCSALTDNAVSAFQVQSLDFDPTSVESALFSLRLPNGWNNGTITARFYWSHAATTTDFGVRWVLGAVAVSNDDTMLNTETAQQAVNDTGGTTDDLYITDATAALTIAGSPADLDMLFFKISRDVANAADTLAVDARLHGIELFYTITTLSDA
jgi:hypothetical protein